MEFIPEVVVRVRKGLRLERYKYEEGDKYDRWIFLASGNFPPAQPNIFLESYDANIKRQGNRSSQKWMSEKI